MTARPPHSLPPDRAAEDRPTATRPVRVLALMNQKGGVGKTTTTVNLAAGLAEAGRSTLVVDLDPQAHATLHLGATPEREGSAGTVYDALLDPAVDPASCVRATGTPNLSVLPSETDLAAAETELSGQPGRHGRLRKALARLGGTHEFILLDCPPSLGLLTMNGLVAAQEVLIPMQAHFLALQGVGKLLETIQLVRQSLNPELRVAGVVLCMHDAQTTHAQEVVADLETFFEQSRATDKPWAGARVYRPPIRRNIKLAECPSFGQTIFQYAPWAPGALDYRKLAETMVAEWDLALEALRAGPAGTPGHQAEIGVPARPARAPQGSAEPLA